MFEDELWNSDIQSKEEAQIVSNRSRETRRYIMEEDNLIIYTKPEEMENVEII